MLDYFIDYLSSCDEVCMYNYDNDTTYTIPFSPKVKENGIKFLRAFYDKGYKIYRKTDLNIEDTNCLKLVIKPKEIPGAVYEVTIRIAENNISWFTELGPIKRIVEELRGEENDTNFEFVPEGLVKAIDELYKELNL